jgi:hypothetical protein
LDRRALDDIVWLAECLDTSLFGRAWLRKGVCDRVIPDPAEASGILSELEQRWTWNTRDPRNGAR